MCAENSCQRPQNLSRINCLSALNVIEWIDMVKQTGIYVFQLWIDRLSHSNVCIIHLAWKRSHFGIFLQNLAVLSISYFKFNSAVYWLGGAKLALISCKIDCVFSMSFFHSWINPNPPELVHWKATNTLIFPKNTNTQLKNDG